MVIVHGPASLNGIEKNESTKKPTTLASKPPKSSCSVICDRTERSARGKDTRRPPAKSIRLSDRRRIADRFGPFGQCRRRAPEDRRGLMQLQLPHKDQRLVREH